MGMFPHRSTNYKKGTDNGIDDVILRDHFYFCEV